MAYNNNDGGYGSIPVFGNMCNGFGGMGLEALMFLLFFGMWGGGMWGGGFGGFGGRGLEQATTTAAETAALVGQQQVADRVASINTGVDAVNGIATANGVKIESVKDAVTSGFNHLQTDLCSAFNNAAMQAVNNHNNVTSQLTDIRFDAQKCCCETQNMIQSRFGDLAHQMQADKCETLRAIADSKAEILSAWNARAMAELEAKNIELKNQISQSNQTAQLMAAIQAQCAPRTACTPQPCAPCNPCYDGVQRAVNDALGTRIGELLFPTTTTAAA